MTVYVDTMRAKFGRMTMCHMVADTRSELYSMANKIGVHAKWIQRAEDGHSVDHFDICLSKRALAIAYGAVELNRRQFVNFIHKKRGEPVHESTTTTSEENAGSDTRRPPLLPDDSSNGSLQPDEYPF